jgi:hypothetical protein
MRNVSIKHIVLLKLERMRKDNFPLKKDTGMWDRLASTYEHDKVPPKLEAQIPSLMPMARYFTSDLENGFVNDGYDIERRGCTLRGGINAKNAHTTSTYTIRESPVFTSHSSSPTPCYLSSISRTP